MVNKTSKKDGQSLIEDKTQQLSKKVWELETKKEAKLLPTSNGRLGIEQRRKMPEGMLVASDHAETATTKRFFLKQSGTLYYADLILTEQ